MFKQVVILVIVAVISVSMNSQVDAVGHVGHSYGAYAHHLVDTGTVTTESQLIEVLKEMVGYGFLELEEAIDIYDGYMSGEYRLVAKEWVRPCPAYYMAIEDVTFTTCSCSHL